MVNLKITKESLGYGYKRVTYDDGSVRYFDVRGENKRYPEISEDEARDIEKQIRAKLPHLRRENQRELDHYWAMRAKREGRVYRYGAAEGGRQKQKP